MTSIAEARKALEELKTKAALGDKRHYDTLSAALESLGKRVNELERNVGHAGGMAAAAAGFAASLPGADAINVADATAMATQLATKAEQAEFDVKRIAGLAKKNKRS
jgi:hypothetical protein